MTVFMYMYVATALFLKNTAIKKNKSWRMEKTQLNHKATLTYTFQEVETISFMAFSPGEILPYHEFNDWFQCSTTWISLCNI